MTVPSTTAAAWLTRWDVQQERYIADREERFTVLGDVVTAALADIPEPVVIDLGCGPGSLAARLHRRLPHARIIGLDSDPLLLGLARSHYGDLAEWQNVDLKSDTWSQALPTEVHAAVSTTALHWLPTDRLAAVYRELARLMPPAAIFANGDHLPLPDPALQSLAETVRHSRATRAGVTNNEDWQQWWTAIEADPELRTLVKARTTWQEHVKANATTDTHNDNGATITDHIRLLTEAGFTSAAPLWQTGDDHVLVALR